MRLYKHIEALKSFGEVSLLILQKKSLDFDPIAHLTEFSGIQNKIINNGIALLSSPENAVTPTHEELEFVNKHLASFHPDLFFCFRLDAARVLESENIFKHLKQARKIFDLDDIESKAAMRAVKSNREIYGRIYTARKWFDSFKLRAIERRAFTNFDDTFVCSGKDQEELSKKFKALCSFRVVPNTIDLNEPLPTHEDYDDQINLLFVGTMSYHPNVRAMEYFVDKIYPLADQLTDKRLHLYIVGHNPPERILKLNERDNITVTGSVDSVLPYYELSHIVICPILSGGGTRIKIIEAMALNRPVVSTTLGAEGLDVTSGSNISLADTPQEFSDSIYHLIEQPSLRKKIASNGVNFAQNKYSTKILKNIYQELFKRDDND